MKRKLKDHKGLTLVEALAAVVVLVLLVLLLNTGMQMAVKSYHDITAESETQLVLATAVNLLADELRYARDVKVNDEQELVSYHSDSYGTDTVLTLENGQILASGLRVLPPGAYGNGAHQMKAMEIVYDGTCFTVRLRAEKAEGSAFAETEFTVRCLNAQT